MYPSAGSPAPSECWCAPSVATRLLTQVVAVPVDDSPVAVLAPVEVGDAQCVVLYRARVERGVLVSHRVGQIAADPGRDQVVVERPACDDLRHRRLEYPPHFGTPGPAGAARAEQGDRFACV